MYRGPTTRGTLHRHAAFQIAIGIGGDVQVVDAAGTHHQAQALVVAPMARHSLLPAADLLTFFIEPQCTFADRLRERYPSGITAAPELRDLCEDDIGMSLSIALDPRLVQALNLLRDNSIPMATLAATVGLSPQRLRALAREQLGMPLPRWRVWTRLRRAAEALQAGQSLSEAASVAGFSDQAHLTRQMREMMGITPAAVLPALRDQSLRAT
jgi:AraC-like DNA-binding protein